MTVTDSSDRPDPGPTAPGEQDLPWKATAERRDLWGPVEKPLEGTVHTPGAPRRGRLLGLGLPLLLGVVAGAATLLLGIGGIGGIALAAGVGVVAAGGSGLAVRALRPEPPLLEPAGAEVADGTRTLLEGILRDAAAGHERIAGLRASSRDAAVGPVLGRAEDLYTRIEALARTEEVQSRRPSDGGLALLEGMADRYVPELLDAVEDTAGFLATFAGAAREEALTNLRGIDEQLTVLGESLEEIEKDLVAGVTRSLDVHAEFLRTRFADHHVTPTIDL